MSAPSSAATADFSCARKGRVRGKTAVTKLMRISWVSVGEIADRVVKRGGLTGPRSSTD
jgi:hypothetical protein